MEIISLKAWRSGEVTAKKAFPVSRLHHPGIEIVDVHWFIQHET
jgi:hypothetical protein